MTYWIKMWKNMFKFNGRASRAEFWYAFLAMWIANVCVTFLPLPILAPMVIRARSTGGAKAFIVVAAVIGLLLLLQFVAYAALSSRRLHDVGKSGKLLLAVLVPAVLMIAVSLYFRVAIGEEVAFDLAADGFGKAMMLMGISSVLSLISGVAGIYLIVLWARQGTVGPNKYGADPRAPGDGTTNYGGYASPYAGVATPRSIKYCTQCGQELPANATFCGACGAKLEAVGLTEAEPKRAELPRYIPTETARRVSPVKIVLIAVASLIGLFVVFAGISLASRLIQRPSEKSPREEISQTGDLPSAKPTPSVAPPTSDNKPSSAPATIAPITEEQADGESLDDKATTTGSEETDVKDGDESAVNGEYSVIVGGGNIFITTSDGGESPLVDFSAMEQNGSRGGNAYSASTATSVGECVYYVRSYAPGEDGRTDAICRVKADGSENTVLYDPGDLHNSSFELDLQVVGDNIYYSIYDTSGRFGADYADNGRFGVMKTDGTENRILASTKEELIDSFYIKNGRIYYAKRSNGQNSSYWSKATLDFKEKQQLNSVYLLISKDERKSLHTFFSNFSEAGLDAFDADNYDTRTVVDFAVRHDYINNSSRLGRSGDFLRVSADYVEKNAELYLGITSLAHERYKSSQNRYDNGYYYFTGADGAPMRWSQVTDFLDNGDGTFTAVYDVYESNNPPMNLYEDKADWTLDGEEYYPRYSCVALVKPYKYNGRDTYQLVYLKKSR